MENEIEISIEDGKATVVKTITAESTETYTYSKEEVESQISDIQKQIDYLEEQKTEKQSILNAFPKE